MPEIVFTNIPFPYYAIIISISAISALCAFLIFIKNIMFLRGVDKKAFLAKTQGKFFLFSTMICLILIPLIYIIHASISEGSIDLLLMILMGINSIYWLANALILRMEKRRERRIPYHLIKMWIFNFVLHSINVINYITLSQTEMPEIQNFMIYSCCDEFFYLLFLIFLYIYRQKIKGKTLLEWEKDYDNKETSAPTDKRKSQTIDNSFQRNDDTFLVFTDAKRRKSDLSINPLTSIMENRSSERSFSSVRPPVTPNVTGSSKTTSSVDPENIQSINVQFFSKILRKKKETIIYHIEFSSGGKTFQTQRSYSEFCSLYKQMKGTYSELIFPVFPPKRPKDFNQEIVIRERMESFDNLLKFLLKERLINSILIAFLWPKLDVSCLESKYTNLVFNKDRIEESKAIETSNPIPNQTLNRDLSCLTSITFTSLTHENINMPHPPQILPPQQFRTASQKFQKIQNTDLRNTLIPNYSQTITPKISIPNYSQTITPKISISQASPENEKNDFLDIESKSIYESKEEINYNVEVVGHHLIDKRVFYEVVVKRSEKIVSEISKSYENFKELHEEMRNIAKSENESIEELPNKGKLGIFASESKVIEYRVFALQVHLKYLVNHTLFRHSEALKAFLGLS